MNYKAILITAVLVIALCAVSVSAVWMNGNWITQEEYDKITDGATVVHNPGSDVTSKYRDMNPANAPEVFVGTNTCTLEGNVRAGYNTLTKEVLLANVLAPNETPLTIPILPDGTFRYEGLAQGNYTLKVVPQFEGLGPEQVSSVTCDHGVARPESELNGYAITVSGDNKCVPSYTIESAVYGSEPVCHEETLVSDWHKCGYHLEYRYMVGSWVSGKKGHGGYCDYSDSEWSEWADVFYQSSSSHQCIQREYRWTKHVQVCEGDFLTVTSNVQQAVASGHTSFLFNNAENPGGIWDVTTTERLSTIEDPAPNHVKDVIISYQNGCGMDTTITTQEYCTIDLAAGSATCPSQTS